MEKTIIFENKDYKINREVRSDSPYKYDFVLDVKGDEEEIVTATEIESTVGISFDDIDNWISVLKIFAEGYIQDKEYQDGLNNVKKEYL